MRRSVKDFANNMELVLQSNNNKTGWHNLGILALYNHIRLELDELRIAIHEAFTGGQASDEQLKNIAKEACDVANFAMMISDNLGIKLKREDLK